MHYFLHHFLPVKVQKERDPNNGVFEGPCRPCVCPSPQAKNYSPHRVILNHLKILNVKNPNNYLNTFENVHLKMQAYTPAPFTFLITTLHPKIHISYYRETARCRYKFGSTQICAGSCLSHFILLVADISAKTEYGKQLLLHLSCCNKSQAEL